MALDPQTVGSSRSYNYDGLGNWTDVGTFNGFLATYFNPTSEIPNFRSGFLDSLAGVTYDPDLDEWDWTGSTRRMGWSASGLLLSYQEFHAGPPARKTVTYGYDAFGRRVRKTVNGVSSYYVWDGDNLYAQIDAAGNPMAEYTYYPGIDVPHSVRIGGRLYYYALEYPGHVIGLMDSTGNIPAEYGYSPFGVLTSQSYDNVGNALRYGAREYDAETGFYYQRARYYDPSVGRFLSADPAGGSVPGNPYAYANNDPINATDPSGLEPCPKTSFLIHGDLIGDRIETVIDCTEAAGFDPGDEHWHGVWGAQPFTGAGPVGGGGFTGGGGSATDAGKSAVDQCRDNILATTGSLVLDIAGVGELSAGARGLYDFYKVAAVTRSLPLSVPRAILAANDAKLLQLAKGVGLTFGSGALQGATYSYASEAAIGSSHDWVNYIPVPFAGTLNGLYHSYKACFDP